MSGTDKVSGVFVNLADTSPGLSTDVTRKLESLGFNVTARGTRLVISGQKETFKEVFALEVQWVSGQARPLIREHFRQLTEAVIPERFAGRITRVYLLTPPTYPARNLILLGTAER